MRKAFAPPRQFQAFKHFLTDPQGKAFTVSSLTTDRLTAIGMCVKRYPKSQGYTLIATR